MRVVIPLLALLLTLAGCSSTYHPEYHPVTVTHVVVNNSGGAPSPPVIIVPPQQAVPIEPPEPVIPDDVESLALPRSPSISPSFERAQTDAKPEVIIGSGVTIGGNVQINGNVTINGDVYFNGARTN